MHCLNISCRCSQCHFVCPCMSTSSTYTVHIFCHSSSINWFSPSARWQLKKVALTASPCGIPDHSTSRSSALRSSSTGSVPHSSSSASVNMLARIGTGGAAVSKCLESAVTSAPSYASDTSSVANHRAHAGIAFLMPSMVGQYSFHCFGQLLAEFSFRKSVSSLIASS